MEKEELEQWKEFIKYKVIIFAIENDDFVYKTLTLEK